MDATHEEWRPVVGHEGSYEVSNLGRVRSLDRMIYFPDGRKRRSYGRILKPWSSKKCGHLKISLGSKTRYLVHVLVLESFIGPRPSGLVACHNNGIGSDNRIENLRWDTYRENNLDLTRHGTHFQAKKTHCPHGHEYTEENTVLYSGRGSRERLCKTCQRRHATESKRRLRAASGVVPRGMATHCKRGHEFSEENTYMTRAGSRSCRTCARQNLRDWRNRKKERKCSPKTESG